MGECPRISILDDDVSVNRALARLCRLAGYEVQCFDSSEAFLAADGSGSTDCLILDVHLPGLSGLELQTRLIGAGRRVPIIFITAFESALAREQALAAGAVAFLHKPLDSDHLLDLIHQVLTAA